MVDGHDDRAMTCEILAVVARLGPRTRPELAAMDPENYGQLRAVHAIRRPHIEIETVFALVRIVRLEFAIGCVLQAPWCGALRVSDAGPSRRGSGRAPAQLPRRRRRIRNPQELADPAQWIAASAEHPDSRIDDDRQANTLAMLVSHRKIVICPIFAAHQPERTLREIQHLVVRDARGQKRTIE